MADMTRDDAGVREDLPVPGWWIAALTALALVLRLIQLNNGLWIDEIYAVLYSFRPSLVQIVSTFPRDTHHPLYAVLAHLSVSAFGESAWAVRLPAAIFGAATIPMLYVLGTRVATRREAFLAATLLCVSYHHVWFSQNARGYTQLAFFAVAGSWLLLRGFETGQRRFFIWYAIAIALGAYTHLTMVFIAVGHAVACAIAFVAARKTQTIAVWKRVATGFALSGVLTLLLYAPVLRDVTHFFAKEPSKLRGVSTPGWAIAEAVRGFLVALGGVGAGAALVALVAGAVIFGAGVLSLWRTRRLALGLFMMPVAVMIAGALAARGTMYPRFFFSLCGYAVLIAVCGAFALAATVARKTGPADTAPRRAERLGTAAVGLLIVLSALSLGAAWRYPKQDYEGAERYVVAHRAPGDTVATVDVTTIPYSDYYRFPSSAVANAADVATLRAGRRVWLIFTFPRYLEHTAPEVYAIIQRECNAATRFRGTVGGGDIYVCTLGATP